MSFERWHLEPLTTTVDITFEFSMKIINNAKQWSNIDGSFTSMHIVQITVSTFKPIWNNMQYYHLYYSYSMLFYLTSWAHFRLNSDKTKTKLSLIWIFVNKLSGALRTSNLHNNTTSALTREWINFEKWQKCFRRRLCE